MRSLYNVRRAEHQQPFSGCGPGVCSVDQQGSYLCGRQGMRISVVAEMCCDATMESDGSFQRQRVVGVGRQLLLLPSGCVLPMEPRPIATHDHYVRTESSDHHPEQGGELLYEV